MDNPDILPRSAPSRKPVKLDDVARAVGVSTITVSRVLRKPEMVSPKLRERVQAAVDALGYIRNQLAGGLMSGASKIVPVLIPTLHHTVFVSFLDGLHAELARAGYQTLLATTEYSLESEHEVVASVLGWSPDGIIIAGVDHLPRTRKILKQAGIPTVEFMDLTDDPIDMNIGFSQQQMGIQAAEYLIQRGCRHIGYAGMHSARDHRSVKRIRAFQDTLRQHGLPDNIVQETDETSAFRAGREMLDKLLERHAKVDGLFFGNDFLAAGALFQCQRRGIRVPEDISLIGSNDEPISQEIHPGLTSIATPRYEMGQLAARMLLARLSGGNVGPVRVDTGFKFVERATTRPLQTPAQANRSPS